jgi:hypothetical protein
MSEVNDRAIAEFRANGWWIETGGSGNALVLIHFIGVHSGRESANPAMSLLDVASPAFAE